MCVAMLMVRWGNVFLKAILEPTSHVDVRRRMRIKSVADECRLNRDTRALCTCGERVIVRHPPSTRAHGAHGRHLLSWAIPRDTWPQKLVPCVTSHSGLHTLKHDTHGYWTVRHSLGSLPSFNFFGNGDFSLSLPTGPEYFIPSSLQGKSGFRT